MKALDKSFSPLAEVDTYESLIFHPKYFDCGTFELYIDKVIPRLNYCYIDEFPGDKEYGNVGIVEKTEIKDNRVTYSGRLLKALLANKVISKTRNFYNKTPEQITKSLVAEFAGQGIIVEALKGLGSPITKQVTGDNLMEFCDSLLETQNLGCEVVYDYINDKKVFRVFQGADNTDFAPLSKNFENINSTTYTHDTQNKKNFAYVAGEANEGQPRVIVEVDLRANAEEEKLELWVDARDLQSEVYNDDGTIEQISETDYKAMLYQRGVDKLQEHLVDEKCVIEPNIDLTLGELRYYKDEKHGIESVQRVVELIYAKEANTIRKDVVWGKQRITRRND